MAEPLTALEKALRALPLDQWEASLELIEKLCRNTAQQPAEEKFRKVKLTNERIKAAITDVPGAVEALLELGWVRAEEEEALVLPKEVKLTMHEHIAKIVDVKHHYKKEMERVKKAESAKMKSLAQGPQVASGIMGA